MSERILIQDTLSGDVYVTDGFHQCGPLHHSDWADEGQVKEGLDLSDFNLDDQDEPRAMSRTRILLEQQQ